MGTKRPERAREKKYTGPAACQAPHWRRTRVRSRGEAEARLWLVESEQKGVLEAAAQTPRREVGQEKGVLEAAARIPRREVGQEKDGKL